jgi:DNA-binding response OmpR family regulator
VLLIEDDEATGLVLRDVLETEGFATRYVRDLDELVAARETNASDLVRSGLQGPLTILITAHREATMWNAADLGLAAIVIKPMDLDDILSAVSAHLPATAAAA